MKVYDFCEGPVPSGFSLAFEESLFNQAEHRQLQAVDGWHSFHIIHRKEQTVHGSIHFHVNNGAAKSPLRSPYGSLECSTSIPHQTIFEFLEFAEERLRSQGAQSVSIKCYPQVYYGSLGILLNAFYCNLGYSVATAEIASVIHVSDDEIRQVYHRSERRKLDKVMSAGFTVGQLAVSEAGEVYSFIQRCRAEKNYELSMSHVQFAASVAKFPEHYLLFAVFDGKKMVAASILIRVKKNIVYDFFHDHDAAYDALSPVTLLVAGMYSFCQQQGIRLLDLGTSAVHGIPNFSLLHFKRFLGGRPTGKYTFFKQLK